MVFNRFPGVGTLQIEKEEEEEKSQRKSHIALNIFLFPPFLQLLSLSCVFIFFI